MLEQGNVTIVETCLAVLLDAAVKGAVVLGVGGLLALVLRRYSAALRHLVWFGAAVGALAMPLLSTALPEWHVLPDWLHVRAESVAESRPALATASPEAPAGVVAPEGLSSSPPPSGDAEPPRRGEPASGKTTAAVQQGEAANAAAGSRGPWWLLALLVWSTGALAALAPFVAGLWSLRRLERMSRRIAIGPLAARMRRLATRIGLRREVRLLLSEHRTMPMHWGILRPRLLLPAAAEAWPANRLRLVLLHELAHARRRDCLQQLVAELLCALYWFNPLVWVARARMRVEREVACDDLVLRAGFAPSDYAQELLHLATGHRTPGLVARGAIAMARPSRLESRLRAVLDGGRNRRGAGRASLGLAGLVLLAALPPLAMARANGPELPATEVERMAEADALATEDAVSEPQEETGTLELEARAVGVDGTPLETCSITFWTAVEYEGAEEPAEIESPLSVWFDPAARRMWEPVHHFSTGDRATKEGLAPGTYRVTAFPGHRDPTQLGVSEEIVLDGSEKHTIVIVPMQDGPALTIEVVDAETGAPIDSPFLFLSRADGLSVTRWSSGSWSFRPQGGVHMFASLAPGRYTLLAGKRAYRHGEPDYVAENASLEIELTSSVDRTVTVKLRETWPDEEETARRWPWVVTGTVTDANGRPLEGVTLHANTGWGTLRPTGETKTDAEGRYTLRFLPGMHMLDEETGEWTANLQAATIHPELPGFFERNLHRQGDLRMADSLPPEDERFGASPDQIVLPDEPHRLDFVMVPGVTLSGLVVDHEGVPVAGQHVSLLADELWPSSSVLHWESTDADGRFTISPVPTSLEVWFEHGDATSDRLTFDEPGLRRIELRLTRDPATKAPRLEVVEPAETPRPPYAGRAQVVDGETGAPVEHFSLQQGRPDPRQPDEILWYGKRKIVGGYRDGFFRIEHPDVVEGTVRLRVLADGYVPGIVVAETEDGLVPELLVVRLERGEPVRGLVLDHLGRPVAGAKVFLAPPTATYVTNGRTDIEGAGHLRTDAEGRFVLEGGRGEDTPPVVVLTPELHAWLTPVSEPGAELLIELPRPAELVVRYDVADDDALTRLRLQLKTWEMADWKGVLECTERKTVENGGEVVFRGLTPGVYDFSRDKNLRVGELGFGAMCDRRTLTLAPGERKVVELTRPKGATISGEVLGLENTEAPGAFVYIRAAEATGDPRGEDWKLTTFDGRTCGRDGAFRTARLAPGKYTAVVHAYEPLRDEERYRTGWKLPDFVGLLRFTIPEEGEPKPLRIPVEPYSSGR